MQYNPQGLSMGDWYVWYLSLEMGPDLFKQHYSYIKPPTTELVEAVSNVEDSYPFDPENGVVRFITPEMLKSPRYQPSATPPPRPTEPTYSPFGTSPTCRNIPEYAVVNTKDGIVARPGKLWKYMTGHLQRLQSHFQVLLRQH